MKLHSFPIEIAFFSIICIFFIIPSYLPLLSGNYEIAFKTWTFPWQYLIFFLNSVFILFIFDDSEKILKGHDIFYKIIFPTTFIFSLLLFISLIFKTFSYYFPVSSFSEYHEIRKPDTYTEYIFCILNFFFSSFFEEVIFRFYFPETLAKFFNRNNSKKIFYILEIISAAVFAGGHLYLGLYAMLNAFFAHLILRRNYRKNRCLHSNIIAHFLYNLLTLLIY